MRRLSTLSDYLWRISWFHFRPAFRWQYASLEYFDILRFGSKHRKLLNERQQTKLESPIVQQNTIEYIILCIVAFKMDLIIKMSDIIAITFIIYFLSKVQTSHNQTNRRSAAANIVLCLAQPAENCWQSLCTADTDRRAPTTWTSSYFRDRMCSAKNHRRRRCPAG